ncbi:MAG: SMI1/KNR4 family protein [Aureliella sp.]
MEHSSAIKQRFQLHSISAEWKAWFDADWHSAELLGEFDQPIFPDRLANLSGFPLMAGLIPPDCIPVIGNGYGDWICARVTTDNSLGELVHWYHGGGDWIPVGENLPQALLHDFVDQYRPKSTQMLRGATEISGNAPNPKELISSAWFAKRSDCLHQLELDEVAGELVAGRYIGAVQLLHDHNVAFEATACDQIEHFIASYFSQFASPKYASECGLNWSTDFVRLLFDYRSSPPDSRAAFESAFSSRATQAIENQDWPRAGMIAQNVLSRRSNLGWARDVAGWNLQRQGNHESAIKIYRDGLNASTFSDQSVRLRTHWISSATSNFAAAQLEVLSPAQNEMTDHQRPITYAAWIEKAQSLLADGKHAEAYDAFFQAGWGVGYGSVDECISLLRSLVKCAQSAGWDARAAAAAAHLQVVLGRKR